MINVSALRFTASFYLAFQLPFPRVFIWQILTRLLRVVHLAMDEPSCYFAMETFRMSSFFGDIEECCPLERLLKQLLAKSYSLREQLQQAIDRVRLSE